MTNPIEYLADWLTTRAARIEAFVFGGFFGLGAALAAFAIGDEPISGYLAAGLALAVLYSCTAVAYAWRGKQERQP